MKNETSDLKVMHFSHNDLDGVGAGIVSQVGFEDVTVVYCGYDAINEEVKNFIVSEEYKRFDLVLITDISVNKEVEELINECIKTSDVEFKLLDHHPTAMHLNENDWALVAEYGHRGKNSGTNMLYDYLVSEGGYFKGEIYSDPLEVFVEKVRRYDSWEWRTHYDDDAEALALNDLMWLIGAEKFAEKFTDRLINLTHGVVAGGSWIGMLEKDDRVILELDRQSKIDYIERKAKQMIVTKITGRKAGVVFAERYISELGNELSTQNPDLDFIVMIDLGAKRVSYRTVKKDIHLGRDVASHFGGGGHPQASGSEIDMDTVKSVIPLVFGSAKLIEKLKDVIFRRNMVTIRKPKFLAKNKK